MNKNMELHYRKCNERFGAIEGTCICDEIEEKKRKNNLEEVIAAAEILIETKSGVHEYASWPMKMKIEEALRVWNTRKERMK